jgi:hypothetical protein
LPFSLQGAFLVPFWGHWIYFQTQQQTQHARLTSTADAAAVDVFLGLLLAAFLAAFYRCATKW